MPEILLVSSILNTPLTENPSVPPIPTLELAPDDDIGTTLNSKTLISMK